MQLHRKSYRKVKERALIAAHFDVIVFCRFNNSMNCTIGSGREGETKEMVINGTREMH